MVATFVEEFLANGFVNDRSTIPAAGSFFRRKCPVTLVNLVRPHCMALTAKIGLHIFFVIAAKVGGDYHQASEIVQEVEVSMSEKTIENPVLVRDGHRHSATCQTAKRTGAPPYAGGSGTIPWNAWSTTYRTVDLTD